MTEPAKRSSAKPQLGSVVRHDIPEPGLRACWQLNVRHPAMISRQLLWCAVPYLPVGSHVAVVDPGVGTERRPVAIKVLRTGLATR